MKDLYFEEEYGRLYEKMAQGKAVLWRYEGPEGAVLHQFILREIPIAIDGVKWYDVVTPYGYGGPVIEFVNEGFEKEKLVDAFYKSFQKYCIENNVVCGFTRFHPIVENALDFRSVYDVQRIRSTLGTDLTLDDPVTEEFSKGCRKNIRRAIAKGISWRITKKPENLDAFKQIYYSTMDRNNAGEYYYFDDEYFGGIIKNFHDNTILVEAIFEEKTIAAGLYFVYGDYIHIHLSGTLTEFLYLSPAYILRYAVTLWGKENGYKLIHHGGGRSNSPEDSLFLFKKQFAQKTEFDFYIGKKVWNPEAYAKLCAASGINPDETDYFPAYRLIKG